MTSPPLQTPSTIQKDRERVQLLIREANAQPPIGPQRIREILSDLEKFECWGPYFRLQQKILASPKDRHAQDYIRLAKIQCQYLEDRDAAAATINKAIQDLAIPYQELRDTVLPAVIDHEDFVTESRILALVHSTFPSPADQVASLERLCLLYEKKTYNEGELAKTYEELLALDPTNIKALRYFKLYFTQINEWDQVVGILRKLLDSVKHPQETFRVAQELAAIALYQQDLPDEAISVIKEYCSDSPLDTSTIMFDAYNRLGDGEGCLRVLRECLLNVDDDISSAILHFKIGQIAEQVGNHADAKEAYLKAIQLWDTFLDPIEAMVNFTLMEKNWSATIKSLKDLADKIDNQNLISQLNQAVRRIEDGLSHASG